MKKGSLDKYRGSHEAVIKDGRLEIPVPYLRALFERNKIGCQNSEAGAKRASLFLEGELNHKGERRVFVYDSLAIDRVINDLKKQGEDFGKVIESLLEVQVSDGAIIIPRPFARDNLLWEVPVVLHPFHRGDYFYFHKA